MHSTLTVLHREEYYATTITYFEVVFTAVLIDSIIPVRMYYTEYNNNKQNYGCYGQQELTLF